MRKTYVGSGLFLALSVLFAGEAGSQQSPTAERESKTKLEEFQAQTGTVVLKGYSGIGKISALGSVEVTAMEFMDATTGRKQTGVAIEMKESGRLEHPDGSLID